MPACLADGGDSSSQDESDLEEGDDHPIQGWGRVNMPRACSTLLLVSQSSAWSFTMPIDCMNAYAVVGPTKRNPRCLSALDMAREAGVSIETCLSQKYYCVNRDRLIQLLQHPLWKKREAW